MKTYALVTLASILVSLHTPMQAKFTHLPNVGTNVSQGISREYSGARSRHRLHTGFMARIDSLQMKVSPYPFPNERFIPKGLQKGSNPALAKLSPQSQISVIDTAIVRSTVDTTRHVYSFNAKAKMTSNVTQKLTGDLWVNVGRTSYTYDASSNMLSESYDVWSNGQWGNMWEYRYTYDAKGNMLTQLVEDWSNGQWVNNERFTYTYDENGNGLSELDELASNGQLVNYERFTYTYDAFGNLLSSLYYNWSNGQWVNSHRDMRTYDANGDMLSLLDEGWSNGQWVYSSRETWTYDANGNLLSYLREDWTNGQWVNNVRDTRTYDASGNMLSLLTDVWLNGQWVNYERFTYTYDASNNILLKSYEFWSNGQWVNSDRFTYTYDAQGNLNSLWHYGWLNSSWIPTDIGGKTFGEYFFVFESAGNDYVFGRGYNLNFTRTLIVTGAPSESRNVPAAYSLSQNYPNPFNPKTVVRYQLPVVSSVSLVVYDVLGREVAVLVNERQEPGVHEVRFDGSSLASGVYFYRIQVRPLDSTIGRDSKGGAGEFVQTKKLLLVK